MTAETTDPANLTATCSCGTELWAERAGEWTLAQRILKLTPTGLVAKCPECRADVPIPWLQLRPTALAAPPRRRMVMKLGP